MQKVFKDNLKKITALLLAASMTMSQNSLAFAKDVFTLDDIVSDEAIIAEDSLNDEIEVEITSEQTEETLAEESYDVHKEDALGSISESDEEAREKECMPKSPIYLNKFLTYLSLEYPEIGIKPELGEGGDKTIADHTDELYNSYNATKMQRQTAYEEIIIDGEKTFDDYPNLTKNMVQFKFLGNFGKQKSTGEYADKVKTLIIRNVDEIRNLYVPASVETLIIENTTLNCYYYKGDSPGFQCGMLPGDLKYCKNLKKLVLKNVRFGDNYKRGDAANLLPEITYNCPYETNYVLNLQNCTNLEELEVDVSFDGAAEVQLAIDGGSDNLFESLTEDNCKINPAPGTGYGQVTLYANANSNLSKYYNSSETVEFKNKQFRLWLLEAIGVDSNNDGVISQEEMDSIETLTINNQTAHSAEQTSLSAFYELADIAQMHGLKTLDIDFYDPSYSYNENRHPLKGIDFPDSLENLTMKNIYWEKDTETKSHDNADIVLTNLKTLELYNTDVNVKESDDAYFDHSTQIEITDTEGVLESCIIEKSDVESIQLINNSNGKGIKNQDEKQRIKFSASECQKLKTIEFLGEGYAVEGSLDLTNDTALTHIGVPNEKKSQWTVYGEFDSTYAPINVVLNSCSKLGSDCEETVIDYDFINGRDLNVQAMDTNFSDAHKLTICRTPRADGDVAGKVYLSCDSTGDKVWVYDTYNGADGFVIENRSSIPTIAVFENGQRIRTSGEGNHNDESIYTEDTDRFVERWDLVMPIGGYSSNFGNHTFYVVDKVTNPENTETFVDSLRKVYYKGDVYVEWNQQNDADSIITLPTEIDDKTGGYKLTGSKLTSTGTPGEVELKLYIYEKNSDGTFKKNDEGKYVKSYIGYQNIKIFEMPDSVELVNDGTKSGSGTKDDPYIVYKNEELKLKARLLVNGEVDKSGDYALRDVYWRIKEYDETPKYTSDSDGYSLYTLDSATKAGISVVRGELDSGETEEKYDKRIDKNYYNHRKFSFDTAGSKFKIVAQMPFKNNDTVITKEVFVEYRSTREFWCSDIEDQIYTGKAVKPKLDIRYGDIPLVEGKDYTLTYSNNVKASSKSAVNASGKRIGPSVTISGKGNYANKQVVYFSIQPRSIENAAKVDDIFVAKTNKDIKISPNVVLEGKKLKQGVDYVISTTTDEKDEIVSLKEAKEYPLYVVGKGNYTGATPFRFTITESVLAGKVTIKSIANQKYDGTPIKPVITITYNREDVADCFDIKYENNIEIGTAAVIVTAKKTASGAAYKGKAGYSFAGSKKVTFKITGTSIKSAKLGADGRDKIEAAVYSGIAYEPNLNVYVGTTSLKKDVDYAVAYTNNINAGTATAIITGKGKYTGTKKFTYKIKKYDAGNDTDKVIAINNGASISVSYEKGGVVPKPEISMKGVVLTEKKDYTIKCTNNKAVAKANAVNTRGKSIAPTIVVTFKGNFSGKKSVAFTITAKDIAMGNITLLDKPVSTKINAWKQTAATIVDTNGKKLSAGTDYNKTFEYYSNPECTKAITDDTLAATTVYVKVTGKNNYEGSYIVGSYRISKTNISTVTATIEDKMYTGVAICPEAGEIEVVVGPKNKKTRLSPGVDYEVVADSYTKNINRGTASVTIRGMGDYYGTKVVKYKIVVNKLLW